MGWRVVVVKMPVTTCPELLPFSSYCIHQPANDFDVVVLSYCLAWRSVLMVNNTFLIEKKVNMTLTLLRLCRAFFGPGDSGDFRWEDWAFVSGHSHRPMTHLQL